MKCKECGKEVSKKASICPGCGVKLHPIKDIFKIVIIFIICILVLGLIFFILSGEFKRYYDDLVSKIASKKINGTYELVEKNYETKYQGNTYNYDQVYKSTYEIDDIYSKINLKTPKTDRFSYREAGLHDGEYIYSVSNKIIHIMITDKLSACFIYEKDFLKQVKCEQSNDLSEIEDLELEYKKVK